MCLDNPVKRVIYDCREGGTVGASTEVPHDKVNEFLLKCGNVHEPYKFCVSVLEGIGGLVEFDEGLFLMLDGNRRIVRKYAKNIPPRWISIYLEYYSRLSDPDFGLDSEVFEPASSPLVRVIDWGKYYWEGDDLMADYIQPRGLKESLTFVLFDLKGSPATAFSLDRTREEPFSEKDVRVANTVAPHLNNLYKNMFVRPSGQVRLWDGHGAEDLTAREREICELLCEGVTPSNISRELHISLGTANKHISHIYKKLEVSTRQELLVLLLGK